MWLRRRDRQRARESGDELTTTVRRLIDSDAAAQDEAASTVARLLDCDVVANRVSTEQLESIAPLAAGITPLINHPSHHVRRIAAILAGLLRYQPATESLLERLATADENIDIRSAAAVSLGRIADDRAVAPLVAALRDHELRPWAAAALIDIGRGSRDVIAILDRAQDAPLNFDELDESEEIAAIRALEGFQDADSVHCLIEALSSQKPTVRAAALDSLSVIEGGWRTSTPAPDLALRAAVAAAVAPLLWDAHSRVRQAALGGFRWPLETLNEMAHDTDPALRAIAVNVAPRNHGVHALPLVLAARADAEPAVRERAAYAFGEIDDAAVIGPLIEMLRDAEPNVRLGACHTLARHRHAAKRPDVRRSIEALRDDPSDMVRDCARAAIQN